MPIEHVLAVVPVADFDASHAWYEDFFGRPADNLPMKGRLVEWRVTAAGGCRSPPTRRVPALRR
jgi:glyoxylase I family protein